MTIDEGRAYALGHDGQPDLPGRRRSASCCGKGFHPTLYNIAMPIWGIAASPLVEGDLVIVQAGGQGACLVAFDKKSGEERWKALDDRASYSSPIMVEQAGRRVLVCWTGDSVTGLDAASGKVFWRQAFTPAKMVINVATPVVEKNRMFFTSFYDGAMMLDLKPDTLAVESLWERRGPRRAAHRQRSHSIIGTPYFEGDYVYGVDSYGEFRCLDAKTGDRVWESLQPTPKSALEHRCTWCRNGDRMWMFNERGELVIARLSPAGYEEISRAKLIEPTPWQLPQRGGVLLVASSVRGTTRLRCNDDEHRVREPRGGRELMAVDRRR